MFSLKSHHRGDSNEIHTIYHFQYKKDNHPKLSQICSYGIFYKGLKNVFETAVVNEPSVFELLKFYYIALINAILNNLPISVTTFLQLMYTCFREAAKS